MDQVALTDPGVGMAVTSPVRALSPVKRSSTPAFSKGAKKEGTRGITSRPAESSFAG